MERRVTIGDLFDRAAAEARPVVAQLELTYKCNLRCSFCYNAPAGRAELDGDAWLRAIDKLKAAGAFHVILTGGEPFRHRDFWKIAAGVRGRGLVLRVYTNGVALADEACADRYAALAPFETEVSLHGADAATHDRLTGVRGSFDKLLAALGNLSRRGLHVVAKTPVTKDNQGQLRAIEEVAGRFGCKVTFDLNITPTDDGDLSPLALAAEAEPLVEFLADLAARRGAVPAPRDPRAAGPACNAGRTIVTIDPYGDVFPCVAWRRRLGNIEEIEDFASFWRTAPVAPLTEVRRIADELPRTTLAASEEASYAAFCPGAAERETGSPFSLGEVARRSGEIRRAAHRRYLDRR